MEEENSSASGPAVIYEPNLLVTSTTPRAAGAKPENDEVALSRSKPSPATNLRVGPQIPDMLIINQSDVQPCHLQ
jgi:phenol 2-monooxygenase